MASTAPSAPAAAKDVKVTLYWLNQSRAQRIVWLLEEVGVPYDVQVFKRGSDMLAPPELKEIHPLGKSPVISISSPNTPEPLVFAESGLIVEYLVDHFRPDLKPTQWQAGKEGQVGGETPAWLAYRYYMHYAEGSLMTPLVMLLIPQRIKEAPVPFFMRWLMNSIGDRMSSTMEPFARTHIDFIEAELAKAPDGGPYMCGKHLTGADILLSFPLLAGKRRLGITPQRYPKITAYVDLLTKLEGFQRAVKRIEEVQGEKMQDTSL